MSARVVIIEDHALTRAGLRTALEGAAFRVVGESGDGITAEDMVVRERPDVAIVDLGLPGRDGVALTAALRARAPQTRVLILTMQEREDDVVAALAAGASAYCVKSSDPATIVSAVRTVASGGAFFDPRIADIVLRRLGHARTTTSADSPLTPRELDIVRLIADGHSNAEIASALHLALGTVKGHIADILAKLAASDRAQAAVTAYRRGFL
jgi:NarL family two-component system response regulator LiaR